MNIYMYTLWITYGPGNNTCSEDCLAHCAVRSCNSVKPEIFVVKILCFYLPEAQYFADFGPAVHEDTGKGPLLPIIGKLLKIHLRLVKP